MDAGSKLFAYWQHIMTKTITIACCPIETHISLGIPNMVKSPLCKSAQKVDKTHVKDTEVLRAGCTCHNAGLDIWCRVYLIIV